MKRRPTFFWCAALLAAGFAGFAVNLWLKPVPPLPADPLVSQQVHVSNVLQFGAVGDGVHDDTDGFEAALQAATTASPGSQRSPAGARVDVPPGTYVLKRVLELHDVLLVGLAAGGWPADGDSMPVLLLDHADVGLSLYDNASVHGLIFRRSATNSAKANNGTRQATIQLNSPGNSVTNVKIVGACVTA